MTIVRLRQADCTRRDMAPSRRANTACSTVASAEAGSRYAFNKSARSLTPREAALLAAVLPNPRRRSAKQPGPAVRRLAAIYQVRAAAQASLAFCARSAKATQATRGARGSGLDPRDPL